MGVGGMKGGRWGMERVGAGMQRKSRGIVVTVSIAPQLVMMLKWVLKRPFSGESEACTFHNHAKTNDT